jgi:serine/threonine protein kinase
MAKTMVVHPDYSVLKPELQQAISDFDANTDYITKGERNVIKKVRIRETVYNIKRFKRPGIFNALVYQFLRKSKAKRSFLYASKLIDMGIKTPRPVAFSESFSLGLKDSYYISEHIDYDLDFRVLNHNPKYPQRDEILRQVAAFTYKLHENNVNFLDHSPGNTLIRDNGNGQYDFYLIDLNRMRFEPMNLDKRMKNFRRLWLSKRMINIMAEEYALLSGEPVPKVHALLTQYSRQFQKRVNSKKLRKRRRNKLH